MHYILDVRLHSGFEIAIDCSFDRGLDGCDQRLDMRRRFAFSRDCVFRRFDSATTLMSKHHDKADGQMIRLLDASIAFFEPGDRFGWRYDRLISVGRMAGVGNLAAADYACRENEECNACLCHKCFSLR